jgi:hypothetical protein
MRSFHTRLFYKFCHLLTGGPLPRDWLVYLVFGCPLALTLWLVARQCHHVRHTSREFMKLVQHQCDPGCLSY